MAGELVVTGGPEVIAGLDAVQRAADDMTETNRKIVTRLIPGVRAATPRRTGALAVSWDPVATATGGSITSGLRHAPFIEFGTSRGIEAYAPVRDTIHGAESEIVGGYEDGLADAAKRAGFRVDR